MMVGTSYPSRLSARILARWPWKVASLSPVSSSCRARAASSMFIPTSPSPSTSSPVKLSAKLDTESVKLDTESKTLLKMVLSSSLPNLPRSGGSRVVRRPGCLRLSISATLSAPGLLGLAYMTTCTQASEAGVGVRVGAGLWLYSLWLHLLWLRFGAAVWQRTFLLNMSFLAEISPGR